MNRYIILLVIIGTMSCEVYRKEDLTSQEILTNMIGKESIDVIFKHFHKLTNKHQHYSLYSELGVKRFNTFKQSIEEIVEHNSNPENSWKKGITTYADLTEEEYKEHRGYNQPQQMEFDPKDLKAQPEHKLEGDKGPYTPFDWRDYGAVNKPIESPRSCPSSTSLAFVQAIETCYWSLTGTLLSLSSQQVVDCYNSCANYGPYNQYRYFLENGLQTSYDYKWTGARGACTYNPSKILIRPKGFVYQVSFFLVDAETMYKNIRFCPYISIMGFMPPRLYTGGVYNPTDCNGSGSYYGGLSVLGYGIEAGKEYWLVNNSNGPTWGEGGFLKLQRRDDQANCGIGTAFMARPIVE